jgi:hypothetical protein
MALWTHHAAMESKAQQTPLPWSNDPTTAALARAEIHGLRQEIKSCSFVTKPQSGGIGATNRAPARRRQLS